MPGLERGQARLLPVPGGVPSSGRILADSNYPGRIRPIALTPSDRLQHLHVIGPTGSGKSWLLANLVLQDIAAGDGVVVIDPKGDLVEDVLARADRRAHKRIIVLDPTDDERPIGINLLDHSTGTRDLVVESVVGVFHELYRAFWGPRSDDILRAAVSTLVTAKEAYTVCEIAPLLTHAPFRRTVLRQLPERDPVLASFWRWYEEISDGERTAAIGPVLNKLRAFTMRPRLRQVVGQTDGLKIADAMRRRRVLLVTLNSGLLGRDAAQLLGSLIVAQLWQAGLQRVSIPQDKRRPVMVTIDEVQDFLRLPVDIGDMLAQARGLGIGLTLAHQHLGQLSTELKAGVLANARSRVMFRLGRDDARAMAAELEPHLSAEDMQGLQRYETVLRLTTGSQVRPPTTGVTRDLPPPVPGQSADVRRASRERWGRPAREVAEATSKRQGHNQRRAAGRQAEGPGRAA
jgi:type IV secretory pathway TraG/TraD family ATPase VirD4